MKKILLIEDNLEIRENTAEILELADYKVFAAENGREGLELAVLNKPDLIICDVMMPKLNGYDVLNIIHENPVFQNTPFIFLSARTEKSDFQRGMQLGADDYIFKPFEGDQLLHVVDSKLKMSKADSLI